MNIVEMRNKIISTLSPLIGEKYVLLEIPHYFNIGDILIWEGELKFLSQLNTKMLYSCSSSNFDEKKAIPTDVTILLQGGGNWGDIWKEPHNFRKKIISLFPNNKIIVFPQTIHYNNMENLKSDAEFFGKHTNLTICARDNESFNILQTYFKSNTSYLLPDMAFFLDKEMFKFNNDGNKILFAKRLDKEYSDNIDYKSIPINAEVHDWPTYENYKVSFKAFGYITKILSIIDKVINTSFKKRFIDFYWKNNKKKELINVGVQFLSQFKIIYTTRLHIAILGIIMGKEVYILDNNYGKLSGFYNTWLKDFNNVKLL